MTTLYRCDRCQQIGANANLFHLLDGDDFHICLRCTESGLRNDVPEIVKMVENARSLSGQTSIKTTD